MEFQTQENQALKRRCIIYIDGYNWYHAIFKYHPEWKWLNIQSFFEAIRPHDNIIFVKMFSALVDPKIPASDARQRQEKFFGALKTLPKVQIILGAFQPREVTCRASCQGRYSVQEEKKTDVNLAVHLMSDAIGGHCDHICVVTGDSDVQPAVEWVAKNKPLVKLTVYVPCLQNEQNSRRTDYYTTKGLDVECKFLPLANIKDHQLKNAVLMADGKFAFRPHIWQTLPVPALR